MKTKLLTGSYHDMRRKVYEIKNKYPFVACNVCARSWAGRAIFTLGIGNQKDVVIYTGCINASHGASVSELLRMFENICRAYSRNERICGIRLNDMLEAKGVLFVPCINPDGMEMHSNGAVAAGCYAGLAQRVCSDNFESWRANAAGVDLSHNISDNWNALKQLEMNLGYTAPGAKYYGGRVGISEPETRAFVKLCRERYVRHIMTVGCGENRITASRIEDEKQSLMLKILGLCSGFETGACEQGVDTHNGFVNWFSAEFGRPAFAIEYSGKDYSAFEEICILSAAM